MIIYDVHYLTKYIDNLMVITKDVFLRFSLMISENIYLEVGIFIFKKLIIIKIIIKTYK